MPAIESTAGYIHAMRLLAALLELYACIIVIRALASWLEPDPRNPIWRILVAVTEPALRPLRRVIPPHRLGGIDLSPWLALILIAIVRAILL